MKAIYFEKTGSLQDVLELGEFEKRQPGTNEVSVKVLASPVNPSDIYFVSGTYRIKPVLPQKAGLEGAGIIEAVGKNVDLKVGSLVAFLQDGAWAESNIITKENLFPLPSNFPLEKAAQFIINPITAWGLLKEAQVKENDWLLVTAGNSSVAAIITQIAKFRKINIILTVRNEKYISGLKELGANEIIYLSKESLQERVNEITNGKGVAAALDAVSGKTGTEVLKCIAPNGTLIAYGRLDNEPVSLSYELLVYRFVSLKGFGVRSFIRAQTTKERNEMIQSLVEIIGDENFKLKQASEYALEDFKDAVEAMQSYQEKIILRPN